MTHWRQRSSGLAAFALAALLYVVNALWLVPTSPAENPRGYEFLPVKHESLSIQVGPVSLELSRLKASYFVIAGCISLVIMGGLLLWRSAKG